MTSSAHYMCLPVKKELRTTAIGHSREATRLSLFPRWVSQTMAQFSCCRSKDSTGGGNAEGCQAVSDQTEADGC